MLRMRRMLPRRLCHGASRRRRSLLHGGVVRPDRVRLRGHHRDRERRLRVVRLLLLRRRLRLRREGRGKVERRRGLHRERLRL